jgi:hypothetical protein
MTQKELITRYIMENDSILPAKMSGKVFMGKMFGSEVSRRCREIRAEGKLISKREKRFERFFLA